MRFSRLWIKSAPIAQGKRTLLKHIGNVAYPFVCKTHDGFRVEGTTRDLIQRYIYCFGVWEPNLSAFLKKRLSTHGRSNFIDIGANIGYFTLLAGTVPGMEGKVVAIEAHPQIFDHLRRNIALNKQENITAINAAVLDRVGEVELFDGPDRNIGSTTVVASRFAGSSSVRVSSARLVDLVDAETISKTATVKIDVEGAEVQVVQGLTDAIALFPEDVAFVIEISPDLIGREGRDFIFDFFESKGFSPYSLRNSYDPEYYWTASEPRPPELLQARPESPTDVIFVRGSKP